MAVPAGPLVEQLTHFACPGHFLVDDLVRGWLDCAPVHWQVIFESYFPSKKIYSTHPGLLNRTFFRPCKGTIWFLGNFVFGHIFCFFVWNIITGIEIYATFSVAKRKPEKKKNRLVQEFFQVFFLQLQKLGLTVMIFFHLILHPTVPIYHIYYSLFHLFSFVVVSVLQSFDAHGKEEKLSPGVYNLVRIKLWCQLSSTWITLFTGEISVITYLLDSNWSAG